MTARTELTVPEVGAPGVERHIELLVEALRSPATGLATAQRWGRLLAVPLLARPAAAGGR